MRSWLIFLESFEIQANADFHLPLEQLVEILLDQEIFKHSEK